jgi:hypothetical protein
MYRFYFLRALLKYKAKKYNDSLEFINRAQKYSSRNNCLVWLFGAYLATIIGDVKATCANIESYYQRLESAGESDRPNKITKSERLWLRSFAQYIACACPSASLAHHRASFAVRTEDFREIDFEQINPLYAKMFPFYHAPDIERVLEK